MAKSIPGTKLLSIPSHEPPDKARNKEKLEFGGMTILFKILEAITKLAITHETAG